MGLAGPKTKQRISADPNNLQWSRDTNKFGYKMLANMGWVPGKGLGLNENGGQEHVKISLKENNYGVGANKKNVDNWLENSSAFTKLLQELNERVENDEDEYENESEEERPRKKAKKDMSNREDLPKKKAKKDIPNEEKTERVEAVAEMKKNLEVKEKKQKLKKAQKVAREELQVKPELEGNSKPSVAIRLASRAKFLRNKRLATTQSADSLNEILGIRSDSSASVVAETDLPLASDEKECKETVFDTGVQLKVNKMSAYDYFATRMKGLKLNGIASSGLAAAASFSSVNISDSDDPRPLFGLGFSNNTGLEVSSLNFMPSPSMPMIDLEALKEKQGDLVNENAEHWKVKTKQKTLLEENQHKPTKKKKSKKTAKGIQQSNEDCNDNDRKRKWNMKRAKE
ncbi:hypothetical protein BC937DRAFT_90290 [Endogone sp. FLAS-F59071]|nr:hypothetical protein BC937DRAFT_90290 [Endogone sp. FLAS-F59071]|eukprot:RUS17186.1 hypothetical protein BC937DRAFT_90290 [Endogone sp. FLAS-F59071]